MRRILFISLLFPGFLWAQEATDKIRSTGFPVFPKIENTGIAGAPILGQPTLVTGTKQEIRAEKHGLAYPSLYDWNGDGKLDLLVGEFETGQVGSNIKVFLNEGTKKKPKYSGEYFYARTQAGDTITNHQWCCIGIHPRFVDMDGDGRLDMLSGQYFPGLISMWRGKQGGFADREFVEQEGYRDQKELKSFDQDDTDPKNHLYWNYTAASFADFDGDGLLDLFVGGGKNLRVALNIGTKEHPKFGLRQNLLGVDGWPVRGQHVDSEILDKAKLAYQMPNFLEVDKSFIHPVDWDGDGVLDLLVSHSYSSSRHQDPILFYRGVQTDKGLRFLDAVPLLTTQEAKKIFPGVQPNFTLVDYNNDGVLDLVFGLSQPTVDGYDIDSLVSWSFVRDIEVEAPGKDAGRAIEYEPGGMAGLIKKVNEDPNMRRYYLGKLDDEKYLSLRHRGYVYVMLGERNPVKATPIIGIKAEPAVVFKNEKSMQSDQDGPVQYIVKAPAAIQRFKEAVVEVTIDVRDGWYVYADHEANVKAGFVPTHVAIELPEAFEKVGEVVLPKSHVKGGAQVYTGKVVYQQKFRVKGLKRGDQDLLDGSSHPIQVQIVYQTCNAEMCLPPVEESVEVAVNYVHP